MPLSDETLREIEVQVRGGFEDRQRILELFCEEVYPPGELDPAEVAAAVDAATAAHEVEKAGWPAVTDCDRLRAAFDALRREHIVALENAGYTNSDGHDEVSEAVDTAPDGEDLVGYCFFHGQDLESVVAGGGLYLTFGPIDPDAQSRDGPVVGRMVVSMLERAGLAAVWDGTFATRIHLPRFDWKRR